MNAESMDPFGEALQACFNGETGAQITICRDDGLAAVLPASHFFREPSAFTAIECAALEICRGRVLDIGAGAGIHSLELQRRGLQVIAVDISPLAVEVMRRRGVKDALCSDIFKMSAQRFDTLLLLGHGVGMMETLSGLDRFLLHARSLLSDGGQILVDSMDPAMTNDPRNLDYHISNRAKGKYIGEVVMQFEYNHKAGLSCGWLHIDPQTLCEHAAAMGWSCTIVIQLTTGDYLARLITTEQ